jgi:para-aminobenzoate synthetase component 1
MIVPRRLELPWREPALLAPVLAAHYGAEGLIWLDGDGTERGRHATLAADPIDQVCCRGLPGAAGASNPFAALRQLQPGHWSGWLSYEAGAWVEPAEHWKADAMASLWLARHDPLLRFDLVERRLWLEGSDAARNRQLAELVEAAGNNSAAPESGPEHGEGPALPLERWRWHSTPESYASGVERIRAWIASGDLFQANLTACCELELEAETSALELYLRLRRACPAPFAGLLIGGGGARGEAVLSASPERFLKLSPEGQVETRPIKGTRPRHSDPDRDAEAAAELVCSPKDRAENVMIVDLLRNDLGRVCVPGSVQVPQLVGLESYPQVHHLTSVVCGQLRPGHTWVDLLQACWPGGSITGAPKLRACQRLSELEPVARGPYCGSLLRINWDGSFDSNILIRSLLLRGQRLRAHAGCGIVADSDPHAEAEEMGWKLHPLLRALS